MARSFNLRDFTSLITGAHALFVLISLGVASFSILGVNTGASIAAVSGMSIATVGVYATFGLGWVLRRTRSRLDNLDKVGITLTSTVPTLMFVVQPLADAVVATPVLGIVPSALVIGGYVISVER